MNIAIKSLWFFLLLGEGLAVTLKVADGPWSEGAYRGFHLAQMGLAVGAAFLVRSRMGPGVVSRAVALVPFGLALSLIGDVVNSGLINLKFILGPDTPQVLLSIPLFAAAHVLYMIVFFTLDQSPHPDRRPLARRVLITAGAALAIAVPLWIFLVPADAPPVMRLSTLFYAQMVTMMMVSALDAARRSADLRALLIPAGLLFWVSDAMIGYFLARPAWRFQTTAIWLTYFSAQLLIFELARRGSEPRGK